MQFTSVYRENDKWFLGPEISAETIAEARQLARGAGSELLDDWDDATLRSVKPWLNAQIGTRGPEFHQELRAARLRYANYREPPFLRSFLKCYPDALEFVEDRVGGN